MPPPIPPPAAGAEPSSRWRADRRQAFDSNWVIAELDQRGAKAATACHAEAMYQWRHLIENIFCDLKEFKPIPMRADKANHSFAANIYLAAAVIHSR
jgi:hypothetical protein